jgi:hypothetical protein
MRIKLGDLEKAQVTMKAANIAIRKKDDIGLTAPTQSKIISNRNTTNSHVNYFDRLK